MTALGVALAAAAALGALGVRLRRVERRAAHSERERAWAEYRSRRDTPASGIGVEFYCRCGRRVVVERGAPPPTCDGVAGVGTDHEPRVMRLEAGP